MNLELDHPSDNPVLAVQRALEIYVRMGNILNFVKARGRLKRKGITFLATIMERTVGKTALVPIRVEENTIVFRRFLQSEEWNSWNGRHIHKVCVKFCRNMDDVLKKVGNCLKDASNHLIRKVLKNVCKLNAAIQKARRKKDPCRRIHAAQMQVH